MKSLIVCCAAMVLSVGVASAQVVDIDTIQAYTDQGEPDSPLNGQTVTVEGVVYVVAGTYNLGTHYIQDATGGITFFLPDSGLNIGDQVTVTGIVGDFSGEINLSTSEITLQGSGSEPEPLVLTPTEVVTDYETVGNFAAVTGIVLAVGSNTLELATDTVETLPVYIDSDTGIDLSAVDVGDLYRITGPVVIFNGLIELKPRSQADLVEDPDVVGVQVRSLSGVKGLFR